MTTARSSPEHVLSCLTELRALVGSPSRDPDQAETTILALGKRMCAYPPEVVRLACERAADECENFPRWAQLKRLLDDELAAWQARNALQPPPDLDRALNEFVRYAPPQRWRELRERDSDGRIRRAAARSWLAAVPGLDRPGDDRRWRAQKADLADRLVEAFELAVDSPDRACPGGDLWPHVCRVEPGRWRDETRRRWRTADELRALVAEPVMGAVGPLAPAIRDMAASVIRRHAEAGVIEQRDADELLELRTRTEGRPAVAPAIREELEQCA